MNSIRQLAVVLVALSVASAAFGQQRVAPIPEDKMTDSEKQALSEIAKSGHPLFSPLAPMLRSPGLIVSAQRFGEYVYFDNSLEPRIYELAVLLLARQTTQQYEWQVHYPKSIKAGVEQATADAIGAGVRPASMNADEAIAYDFVQELLKRNDISDATYAKFVGRFGERGVVDMIGLLGYYTTIALMMNADRTPIKEPAVAPLLKPLATPLP
jgi:4-carboxymuconolactone decarboxylase